MEAIRTWYHGIYFRSKLEAEWAKFFDSLSMPWVYEPEGYKFKDGTKYLPDFWLSDAKQWFEVKGILNDIDKHKIEMLGKESMRDVIVGYPDGMVNMYDPKQDWWEVPFLNKCTKCNKICFMHGTGIWDCRYCGIYDGNKYVNRILSDMGVAIRIDAWNRRAKIDWTDKVTEEILAQQDKELF